MTSGTPFRTSTQRPFSFDTGQGADAKRAGRAGRRTRGRISHASFRSALFRSAFELGDVERAEHPVDVPTGHPIAVQQRNHRPILGVAIGPKQP